MNPTLILHRHRSAVVATGLALLLAGAIGQSALPASWPAILFASGLAGWISESYRERRPLAARSAAARRSDCPESVPCALPAPCGG